MIEMKLVHFLVLHFYLLDFSAGVSVQQLNVGTVLFTESDNLRNCWSNEQLALIRSRMVFQDLLPRRHVICMDDDRFVTSLIAYFRLAVDKVKNMTFGKTKQIMLMALTDALGGYLHHIVLPLAKHAFYMGNINYESTEKLNELYDELKSFLRTDGQFWAAPIKNRNPKYRRRRDLKPLPMVTGDENSGDPCSSLVFNESENGHITIPLPFFDSKKNPNAIAVPFKTYPLRSLRSKSGSFVLVKYYMTATKCLIAKNASQEQIHKFNDDFDKFLNENVMVRLEDDKLYPAFGSVFRIKESINRANEQGKTINTGIDGYPGFGSNPDNENAGTSSPSDTDDEDHSTMIMFTAVGCVILIWLLTGIIYCVCRLKHKDDKKKRHHNSRSSSKNRSASKDRSASKARSSSCKLSSGSAKKPEKPKEKPKVKKKNPKGKQNSLCCIKKSTNVHLLYETPTLFESKSAKILEKKPTKKLSFNKNCYLKSESFMLPGVSSVTKSPKTNASVNTSSAFMSSFQKPHIYGLTDTDISSDTSEDNSEHDTSRITAK